MLLNQTPNQDISLLHVGINPIEGKTKTKHSLTEETLITVINRPSQEHDIENP